jgi:hypothetical protein
VAKCSNPKASTEDLEYAGAENAKTLAISSAIGLLLPPGCESLKFWSTVGIRLREKVSGSPIAGLTNSQNWATYGIAIASEVALNAVSRAGIYGLVRGGAPPPPPLNGSLSDDGLPNPPGTVTITWGKTKGPGSSVLLIHHHRAARPCFPAAEPMY